MTDWFIDQTDTGNGTTATSAFPSVFSLENIVHGDQIWVRRTHVESFGNNDTPIDGKGLGDEAFPHEVQVIGWPEIDDMHWNERPQSGIDASWDDDDAGTIAKTTFGLNFPTFAGSNALGGFGWWTGGGVSWFNCAFPNLASTTAAKRLMPFRPVLHMGLLDNILLYNEATDGGRDYYNNHLGQYGFGKIYVVTSNSGTTPIFVEDVHARHIVVLSQTIAEGLFGDEGMNVGFFEVLTHSLQYLFINAFNQPAYQGVADRYVGKIAGLKPWDEDSRPDTQASDSRIVVDDYYGEGPRILGNQGHPNGKQLLAAVGAYSSQVVFKWESTSRTATGQHGGWQMSFLPFIRKFFDTTADEALTIKLPVFSSSTDISSMKTEGPHAELWELGGRTTYANSVTTGSLDLWTGTDKQDNGVARFLTFVFTPTVTGSAEVLFYFRGFMTATSGTPNYPGFFLVGEPESA